MFPKKVVDNDKEESCALTVTGTITSLSASRKSIAMDIKIFASISHVHSLENICLLISLMGRTFLLFIGYHELAEHAVLANLQFDPGGHLLRGFVFDPGGFMRSSLQFDPGGHLLRGFVFDPGGS